MVQIEKQKRKKKGRPSKADLLARRPSTGSPASETDHQRHLRRLSGSPAPDSDKYRNLRRDSVSPEAESEEHRVSRRRSLRRRSFRYNIIDYDEDYVEDDDDDDVEFVEDEEDDVEEREDERKEKKVKLVVKLSSSSRERVDSTSRASRRGRVGADDSEEEDEDERDVKKRRRIGGGCEIDGDEDEEYENGEHCENNEGRDSKVEPKRGHVHSTPAMPVARTNHSRTPLPDKKQLELILDKLQKKDTYGVYAEPVDPDELPDYHDIIKHPMDFSTVRRKLANGSYSTLEQFENDVFLISSNAMQYNAPDTVYHKQARAIKELAERKFQRSRIRIERQEKELKSEVQCQPKSELKAELREKPNLLVKNQSKKPSCKSTQEPVCSDFSSGATLATTDAQNTYSADHVGIFERHRNNDVPLEGISFLVDNSVEKTEDLHSGKGVLPKFGKRSFIVDENRRATYHVSNQQVDRSDSLFIPFEDEKKQLIPVGLPGEFSYARSLTRFAASLGPIAWRLASNKIEQVLPPGLKYGRGWVGEYEPLPTTVLVVEDRNEYPLASSLHDVVGPGKNNKGLVRIASGKEHMSKQPSFDGKVASVLGSDTAKLPSTVSVTQHQNLVLRDSRGPENMTLRGSGLSCPSPNNKTNGAAFAKRTQLPRDSVCTEYTGPRRVEQNSPSVCNQKANYIAPRQTPSSREMNSKGVGPNCAPMSIQKTDQVNPKQSSGGIDKPSSRHVESMHDGKNLLPPFSFKQSVSNGGAPEGFCNGKSTNNFVDSNRVIVTSPASTPTQLSGAAAFFHHKQENGLSDPVLVMKMLAEKAQRQQNGSVDAHHPLQSRPSISSPRGEGGSNAAAAAASAWMSAGAVGYRPPVAQMPSGNRSQNFNDQLHNGKHVFYPQAMQSNVEYPVPTTMHFQPEKNGLPFQAFLQQPIHASNEPQNQNRSMAFPPMGTNDLSRFQVHASWHGLSPHTQQKQKLDTLPPDLNVAFQSVDSQQPDLALQL